MSVDAAPLVRAGDALVKLDGSHFGCVVGTWGDGRCAVVFLDRPGTAPGQLWVMDEKLAAMMRDALLGAVADGADMFADLVVNLW